jgi:hypothetical protein
LSCLAQALAGTQAEKLSNDGSVDTGSQPANRLEPLAARSQKPVQGIDAGNDLSALYA